MIDELLERYCQMRPSIQLREDSAFNMLILKDLMIAYGPYEFAAKMKLHYEQELARDHTDNPHYEITLKMVLKYHREYMSKLELIFGKPGPVQPHPENVES